jgi:hypothetical protein
MIKGFTNISIVSYSTFKKSGAKIGAKIKELWLSTLFLF